MPEASDDGVAQQEAALVRQGRHRQADDGWQSHPSRSGGQGGRHRRLSQPATANGFPAQLLGAISREVLPRMIEAHSHIEQDVHAEFGIGERDVAALADLAMNRDPAVALGLVDELRLRHGLSTGAICLQLLSPAAKRLGWLWDCDYCSFIDVTVGLGRLQRILLEQRDHDWDELPKADDKCPRLRALIMPSSGEQHTLGPQIVSECFRLDGWDVWADTPTSTAQLAGLVRSQWFDAIGFSASSTQTRETVTADVSAARAASKNVNVLIMVGGPLFAIQPELVDEVGADAMTATGDEAPVLARHLLSLAGAAGR
jgi:MerR family transcriptional regulator, light-induced transcriptional regulator